MIMFQKDLCILLQNEPLSHLSHNLRFSTDKECRIIDVNQGLLNSDLSSLTYTEMADIVMGVLINLNILRLVKYLLE